MYVHSCVLCINPFIKVARGGAAIFYLTLKVRVESHNCCKSQSRHFWIKLKENQRLIVVWLYDRIHVLSLQQLVFTILQLFFYTKLMNFWKKEINLIYSICSNLIPGRCLLCFLLFCKRVCYNILSNILVY